MLLGELITTLATKVGIESDNESLKKAITSISSIEIDDETANKLSSNLFTEKEAKNNPEIKAKFFSEFADATDKELNQAFKGLGFSDEQLEQLKATEPKTFKRISKLSEEAKRLIEDAKKSTGNDSKLKDIESQYSLKINELNSQVEAFKNENVNLVNKSIERELDWNFDNLISKHNISKAIPDEYRSNLAKQAVKDYLKSKDAKPVLIDGKVVLKRLSDESLDVTDLDFNTSVSKALAEKQLLEVTQPITQTQKQVIADTTKKPSVFQQNLERAKSAQNI
jgi:hypothetical protein